MAFNKKQAVKLAKQVDGLKIYERHNGISYERYTNDDIEVKQIEILKEYLRKNEMYLEKLPA